jgi:ferritin-like metal-binding protein YciE
LSEHQHHGELVVRPSSSIRALGTKQCATVLARNLEEEKAADQKLNKLAESNVNRKAA